MDWTSWSELSSLEDRRGRENAGSSNTLLPNGSLALLSSRFCPTIYLLRRASTSFSIKNGRSGFCKLVVVHPPSLPTCQRPSSPTCLLPCVIPDCCACGVAKENLRRGASLDVLCLTLLRQTVVEQVILQVTIDNYRLYDQSFYCLDCCFSQTFGFWVV